MMRFLIPALFLLCSPALAATAVPFTVNTSEAVTVNTAGGTPRLQLNVGGVTRYAAYTAGSGTAALTFTYTTQAGDLDLDGITVASPLQLNGGTMTDVAGNALSPLTFTIPATSGIRVDHPSLAMDFINTDYLLNGTRYNSLTSFLTASGGSFTRASIGTYIDASGTAQTAASGVPRFEYHPVTHAAQGLLIEESRTNYVTTPDMTTGTWYNYYVKPAVVAATDPMGYTAYRLQMASSGGGPGGEHSGIIIDNSGMPTTGDFVISFRARLSRTDVTSLDIHTGDGQTAHGTRTLLRDGVVVGTDGSLAGRIPDTDWHNWEIRIPAFTRTGGCCTSRTFQLRENDTNAFDLDISRVQVEIGGFATSFIPTAGAAVTRQADTLIIPTGAWYNSPSGAVATSFSKRNTVAIGAVTSLSNAGGTQSALNYYSSLNGSIDSTGSTLVSYKDNAAMSAIANTATHKVAIKYDNSAVAVSRLVVGNERQILNAYTLNGYMESLKYYPVSPASAQLQLLTQ